MGTEAKQAYSSYDCAFQLEVGKEVPMPLKNYQERVVREVQIFLNHLYMAINSNQRYPGRVAWDECGLGNNYHHRSNGLGREMPTFCIKVPTGGGKTLLATQILGDIFKIALSERNGVGLVLWIVPSDQIYKDTLKNLNDRNHFYRQSLEFALSNRVQVWEKHELSNNSRTIGILS